GNASTGPPILGSQHRPSNLSRALASQSRILAADSWGRGGESGRGRAGGGQTRERAPSRGRAQRGKPREHQPKPTCRPPLSASSTRTEQTMPADHAGTHAAGTSTGKSYEQS